MSEDVTKTNETKTRQRPRPPSKLSRENAEAHFDILLDYFEVYDGDKTAIAMQCETAKDEILSAVMGGMLEFSSEGDVLVTQHLRKTADGPDGPLMWKPEKLGVAKHAIPVTARRNDVANNYQKNHALAAAMTGIDKGLISKMHALDQSTTEVVAGLFLSI